MAGIAALIRDRREALGLTRAHLAEMAGVSAKTITNLEAGRSPRSKAVARVLEALDAAEGKPAQKLVASAAAIQALPRRDRDLLNAIRALDADQRKAVEGVVRALGGYRAHEDSLNAMLNAQREKRGAPED